MSMKPAARNLLIALGVVVAIALLYTGYTTYSTRDVSATIEVGTNPDGSMYLRCASASGGAECSGGDQGTLTVAKRDRVHLTIVNKDGGDHTHDFNIQGWQYFFWPNTPEQELHAQTETASFTAWSAGSYHILCEISGHDAKGMRGTLLVQG